MRSETSRRLLAIAPSGRRWVTVLVAILLATTATYVGQGLLIARAIGAVLEGASLDSLVAPVLGVVGLQAVRAALTVARAEAALRASSVKEAVRQALVGKLLELGPGWMQGTRSGSLQSTLVDGVETTEAYVGRFLPQAVAAVIGAAGVTAYLFVLDPLVGAVVFGCALLAPVVPIFSERYFEQRMRTWFRAYRGLYAENLDAVQGMATLKAFNASRRRGEDLNRRAESFCRDSVRLTAIVVIYVGVVSMLIALGTAAAVGVGSVRLANGELEALELLTILLLTREAFRPLTDLEKAYHASYSARPACQAIFEILDSAPAIALPPTVPAAPTGSSLTFDGVRFSYPGKARPALDGFTLEVGVGERVALVGRSGAGKTTTVSLLLRFFDIEEGRILLGGVDIRAVDLQLLRASVAVVAQDTYLFHGTVRHNLQLARADATDEQLVAAARAARAHEFIRSLPDGYDTVVGERGLRLSGGQRQRIAIARALLKDAPILVLDEATSSVDGANEAAIQDAIEELTRGRTTLIIAHRLSTVRSADRVVVMDNGRVVEAGSHHELLTAGGAYADLVAAQGAAR